MREGALAMKRKCTLMNAIIIGGLMVLGGWAISAQDKYTLKVPNGLAFSEFSGYEAWQVVPSVKTAPTSLRSSLTP